MDITVPVNTAMLSGDLVVTVDSTGLKVTNRGEWMREKWKNPPRLDQGSCHDRCRDQPDPESGGD